MSPTNSECLIRISDAFSAFVYGYPSSCPCAHCTPNKSVTTLRYTRRPGPVYTGHACRHLPSAVPWISEDRLLWGTKSQDCPQTTTFEEKMREAESNRGPTACQPNGLPLGQTGSHEVTMAPGSYSTPSLRTAVVYACISSVITTPTRQ